MNSPAPLQAVRGMSDWLPAQHQQARSVEQLLATLAEQYHYQRISTPIVEKTALFKRAVGDVTDIVEKEMYTFTDRNEDSLSLRPEGTAGVVRAAIQHGELHHKTPRYWYLGPMFRRERPQKGRYRQFHQFGFEALGMAGPGIDAEIICLCARLFRQLGLADVVHLQLNSLGTPTSSVAHRTALQAYFQDHYPQLDKECQRRLTRNPLRILDSKNPALTPLIQNAPAPSDFLEPAAQRHFESLCELLDKAGIPFTHNRQLVRGLDYYRLTVFEWITDQLGAQGTVCAGGRYDGLSAQLGGPDTPALGCAAGLERILYLLAAQQPSKTDTLHAPDIILICAEPAQQAYGLQTAEQLRAALPHVKVQQLFSDSRLKTQLKQADKTGAAYALIIGPDEQTHACLSLKPLRGQGEQCRLTLAETIQRFSNLNRDLHLIQP